MRRSSTATAIAALVPGMVCDDILGGLYGPSDGFVDPALTCTILADLLRAKGVTILQQTELVGADVGADGRHVLETTGGTLHCDHVVNAAGAWATPVGALLGTQVTVLPQRHQALFARLPEPFGYTMTSVMDYLPGSGRDGLYFRHDSPTAIVAGLHTEDALHGIVDPDRYRRGGDDLAYMAAVGEQLAERLPAFAEAGLDGVWAGIYPISPDGEPSIGPHAGPPDGARRLRRRWLGLPVGAGHRAQRGGVDRAWRAEDDPGASRALVAGPGFASPSGRAPIVAFDTRV